jgi:CheY-like chemotaxis protein
MTHETSADAALNQEAASPASVLVVDDTIANLRLLSNMLSEEGYDVRAVTNGPQALQAVERDPPDVILLDITMPEMDGYEVCRRLKARDRSKDVPVIFLTALTDTADKVRAFDAGGVDYVPKPIVVEELLAAGATSQGKIAAVKAGPVADCLAGYIRDPNGIIIELLELKKN